MTEDILVRRDGAISEIRLNRPAKKNALTDAMYGVMADTLMTAERDMEIRAVIITAEGDNYCAGSDIAEFAAFAAGKADLALRNVHRFLDALAQAEIPIIAAVTGDAVGVGMTMLLHCDIVIIADNARLNTPFTALGLVPEAASSLLLTERIGYAQAYAMLALGKPMIGAEAARLGIAAKSMARGEVEAAAWDAARECAIRPPEAMKITKRLMRNKDAITARMQQEVHYFQNRLKSPEAISAFEAFLKR